MSQPEGQRKEGKNKKFIGTLDLVKYTLTITKNENIFLPEYRGEVTNKIIDTAMQIHLDAWEANNIRVTNLSRKRERELLQLRAINGCNKLLALMDIAKTMFHLTTKRMKYWTGMVISCRERLRKWADNDRTRYSDVKE